MLRAQIPDCRSLGRLNFISWRLIFYGSSVWYLLHITFWCPDFWQICARYILVFEASPFLLTVPFSLQPLWPMTGRLLVANVMTTKIDATRSYRWMQEGSERAEGGFGGARFMGLNSVAPLQCICILRHANCL